MKGLSADSSICNQAARAFWAERLSDIPLAEFARVFLGRYQY